MVSCEHLPVSGAEVGVSPEVELAGEVHGWRQVPRGVNELGKTVRKRGVGSDTGTPRHDFGIALPSQVHAGVPHPIWS